MNDLACEAGSRCVNTVADTGALIHPLSEIQPDTNMLTTYASCIPHEPWQQRSALLLLTAMNQTSSFTCSATSPSFALLPDCIPFSCCSPIVSAASAAAPGLRPLQLLLPDCVRVSCSSRISSASAAAWALLDCIRFSCAQPSSEPLPEHSQSSRFSIFSTKVV